MVSFLPARWPRREPVAHKNRGIDVAVRTRPSTKKHNLNLVDRKSLGGVSQLSPPCPSRHNGQPRTRNQSEDKYARYSDVVKAQARFIFWLRFPASHLTSEPGGRTLGCKDPPLALRYGQTASRGPQIAVRELLRLRPPSLTQRRRDAVCRLIRWVSGGGVRKMSVIPESRTRGRQLATGFEPLTSSLGKRAEKCTLATRILHPVVDVAVELQDHRIDRITGGAHDVCYTTGKRLVVALAEVVRAVPPVGDSSALLKLRPQGGRPQA